MKLSLLYVYADDEDVPYVIIDPPDNLPSLLEEWNALDDAYMESLTGPPDEWTYVNEWLKAKGVNIVEVHADAILILDDFRKPKPQGA